jgi:hypothetical protein
MFFRSALIYFGSRKCVRASLHKFSDTPYVFGWPLFSGSWICFSTVRLFISDLGNVSEQAYISFSTLLMFLGDHFFPDLGNVCPSGFVRVPSTLMFFQESACFPFVWARLCFFCSLRALVFLDFGIVCPWALRVLDLRICLSGCAYVFLERNSDTVCFFGAHFRFWGFQ